MYGRFKPVAGIFWVLFFTGIFRVELAGQSPDKPKLKDFGSSLRKLKWDPVKKEGRETGQSDRPTPDLDVITIDTSLVACDVLVTDKQGKPVQNLTASDFIINEDGVPQQVGHFFLGDNANVGRSIVLIIDYSRSQFPYIKESVEAAKGFVDKLGPRDRMAIVTDDVELLVDFTNNKRDLKKGLDSLVQKNSGSKGFFGLRDKRPYFGRSAQYSALMATLMEAFDDEDERPIIVFQTDGDELEYLRDTIITPTVPADLPAALRAEVQTEIEERKRIQRASVTEFSLEDVYRAIEKSRATIYTVIPDVRLLGFPREEQLRRLQAEDERTVNAWLDASPAKMRESFLKARERQKRKLTPSILNASLEEALLLQSTLAEVASVSGGWVEFLESGTQAGAIYNRIFADINDRYIVGYYPTNKERDGKRRRISIRVKDHPEYIIGSRKWYYAPQQ